MKTIDKYRKISTAIVRSKVSGALSEFVQSGRESLSVKTLSGSMGAIMIADFWLRQNTSLLIVVPDTQTAENWYHDLKLLIDGENLALLAEPKGSVKSSEDDRYDNVLRLIDGLVSLKGQKQSIAIALPEIFSIKLPSNDYLDANKIALSQRQILDYNDFIQNLSLNGFERKDFVSDQGDFAVRGGIIDIFPIGYDNPLRIEFFGNEIDSIREFNTLSQRSIRDYQTVEFLANIYHPTAIEAENTIIDYLPEDLILVLDKPEIINSENPDYELPDKFRRININMLGTADLQIHSTEQKSYQSSVQQFAKELIELHNYKYKIIVSAEGEVHLERIRELAERALFLELEGSAEHPDIDVADIIDSINWLDETITAGFRLDDERIAFFTEHQIFDRQRIRDPRRQKKHSKGITLQEIRQLSIGDLVVHDDKGIGKFDGFETVKLGGNEADCVRLLYADNDVLYVHLNYLHKIQKYSSQEDFVPKLSKLGSTEWLRKKAKTKKRLKDIARDLIKLYAERKMQAGFAYPADTIWQKEFEASFIYEDTADQAQTTAEVKKDMEEDKPMDRLVCGDVGFGKTEIAIRAAFKAVQAGKQVAVLVPTTILAQQHCLTFKERLRRYPVNTEVISRFRTKQDQNIVTDKVTKGAVDILIGTHRLLSKDIAFKDLGLLIIDEEHRFGVGAKEKLRQLRTNIDTLTLTATPIPRTLNFSLMGARDLSIIETPPRNRLPISTEILEWNDQKLIEIISKEISRKGQVFFVTDKVMNIDKIAMNLQMLMPTYKFGIAHGQMPSGELEKIMEKFIDGKFDVLITTKIVESGLDIPNANTIIINRADNFGLAELYQLRGRVGRSNTQAYCYLIVPPIKTLPTKTLRRLYALEEFTELGSGFQLALRDMEIRGSGNLLGPEQSGYIAEIGFELYQKVLEEAVQELRREEFSELFKDDSRTHAHYFENNDLAIETDRDALLSNDYIGSDTERFQIYKKLYNLRSNDELNKLKEELTDRFGKLPPKAEELIFAVKLRISGLDTGFQKISVRNNKLLAEFPAEENKEFYDNAFPLILEFLNEIKGSRIVQHNKKLYLELKLQSREEAIEILWRIKLTIGALTA